MRSQLFIFDLDGTLIDSRADLAAAVNRMRARHGLAPLALDTIASYVGDGVRMLAGRSLQSAPVDPELATRQVSEAYAAHLTEGTTAYPGVDAGLRALYAAGHVLALATNKPGDLARRLVDHFGWTPLFAVLIGGGDAPELKPSPLPLQLAMQRTGFTPANTWMVGDHHTDIEAAQAAGVRSIYLENGIGHPGIWSPERIFSGFQDFSSSFIRGE